MYKKILVPLDGSKRAEAILPHVKNLALCFKAKVIFFIVIEPGHLLEHDEIIGMSIYQEKRDQLINRINFHLLLTLWPGIDVAVLAGLVTEITQVYL